MRIGVVGAGLIGQRHAAQVRQEAVLAGIADPSDAARAFAATLDAGWYPDLAAMLAHGRLDGVIIATPNAMHVEQGLAAIAAGIPALVEKPIAESVAGAEALVSASERAGVPLLIGHHRRHNPLVQAAKRAIDDGRLGTIVAVHTTCWFHKSPSYFEAAWRREPGAGPLLINAIHDLDLMRFFCGEVASVQAMTSSKQRGLAVEDTASLLLRFTSGALGTLTVSDTIASPWSWEFTSGENPAYSHTSEACTMIGGTVGSLAIPDLSVWSHGSEPDWWRPIERAKVEAEAADPLALQVKNLCDVIAGRAAPVVSGREGLETLRLALAAHEAARKAVATGQTVSLR